MKVWFNSLNPGSTEGAYESPDHKPRIGFAELMVVYDGSWIENPHGRNKCLVVKLTHRLH
jgi:hypothetical protein